MQRGPCRDEPHGEVHHELHGSSVEILERGREREGERERERQRERERTQGRSDLGIGL